MAATGTEYCLSDEQIACFMEYGYLKLANCFSRDKAAAWTSSVWSRLGMDPEDKSTWTTERCNMPYQKSEDVRTFAPKAWAAICQLLGGAHKIRSCGCDDPFGNGDLFLWTDSFIVNMGSIEGHGKTVDPKELKEWHVDGDYFRHFLDSPEQGLLVIPLFSDVQPHGGGTIIAPESVGKIANHLYNHPEGVGPEMTPWRERDTDPPTLRTDFYNEIAQSCTDFVEASGDIGDVYLLHPLMLHAGSNNALRIPRFITNPAVSLSKPFFFERENKGEYSIVEKKTLKELGQESLGDWKTSAPRISFVPRRLEEWRIQRVKEIERMQQSQILTGVGA